MTNTKKMNDRTNERGVGKEEKKGALDKESKKLTRQDTKKRKKKEKRSEQKKRREKTDTKKQQQQLQINELKVTTMTTVTHCSNFPRIT